MCRFVPYGFVTTSRTELVVAAGPRRGSVDAAVTNFFSLQLSGEEKKEHFLGSILTKNGMFHISSSLGCVNDDESHSPLFTRLMKIRFWKQKLGNQKPVSSPDGENFFYCFVTTTKKCKTLY
ncbi:hypothetical protein F2P81_026034 [Scophthalmus maximus]|uniref:Uncharacterized protein n=1 Tax=Scophthalmus maximus TaxID=52904 RepID=A0A6A4RIL0_SCOMX|nr:hypothetical protein F2P81_026034 [Scophthalmus maximus]